MPLKMQILVLFAVQTFALGTLGQDLKDNDIVHLSKESLTNELDKMPHFVMFTHPASSP